MAPSPIPPPVASGTTETTPVPLYWAKYGVVGASRMLVIHGGPGAHHDYLLPQMLELSSIAGSRELLFYDQRGGGKSKPPNSDTITWRTQTDDLALVIAEFGLDAPITVGYSWGALLALLYAAEASARSDFVKPGMLVLIDPAPISRPFRAEFEEEFARRQKSPAVEEMRAALAASGLRDSDPAAYRQRTFELGVAGYFADPRAARDLTPFRVTSRVQQSVWESLGDFDLTADRRLASLRVPTLVVHGRQDPIPLASSQQCAQLLGAELAIIDDCGHVPYVEQPARLWQAVGSFLRTRAPSRA